MVMHSTKFRDDNNWVKSTFVVTLGDSFEDYKSMVEWGSTDEIFGTTTSPQVSPQVQALLDQAGVKDNSGPTPVYFSRRKCRDSSLGGNDAINCYYQYCDNDDISHPFLETDFGNSGMGRVYSEAIDDGQQIMYMSFGLPEYSTMTGFYTEAVIADLANLMNKGGSFTPESLGRLVGAGVSTFVLLPVLPLMFIYKALSKLDTLRITKYYDLRPEMALYYRMVNSTMIHLAVNMGLAKDGRVLEQADSEATGSDTSAATYQEQFQNANSEAGAVGLPDAFTDAGWDIYRILLRKYYYEKEIDSTTVLKTTDQALMDQKDPNADNTVDTEVKDRNWSEKWFEAFGSTLYDANLFIGFRVEKSVDTSESISNQTTESPVAQMLNAKFHDMRSLKNSMMGGQVMGGPVGTAVGSVLSSIKGFADGALDMVGIGGVSHMLTGAGIIDVPEVWSGSSFSKNYSFNMALRSPYGDPVSIYQSIYVPMSLLLTAALPRAVGVNSYTSPFLVRAYCKGMLAVPLGIIDSVSIKRGADQHGWNYQRLPTAVDISFTIKDLSPAMYMALGDESAWDMVTGANSSWQEYLLTLSGVGLQERIRWLPKVRRKAEIFLHQMFNTRLNPIAWGMDMASTGPGRVLNAIAPKNKLPTN